MKREKLRDILRRVVANPDNLAEAAREIAEDWSPKFHVNPKGKWEIIIGDGKYK